MGILVRGIGALWALYCGVFHSDGLCGLAANPCARFVVAEHGHPDRQQYGFAMGGGFVTPGAIGRDPPWVVLGDRKSTRLNSSHT